MNASSLSIMNPAFIKSTCDQLAGEFARRIFEAIPEICECIEFEAEGSANARDKLKFGRASQLLYARRRDLQTHIATAVSRIFTVKMKTLLDGASPPARLSLDALSLLADERLDEEIAINSCSRRLKEQCEYEIWGLSQRICSLTGIHHVADAQNPVFPQTFAQALMEAIAQLEPTSAIRLVIFKTFGPVLLEILPAVCAATSMTLEAQGIQIESGDYYGRPVLTPERAASASAAEQALAAGTEKTNSQLNSTLQDILQRTASTLPVYVEPAGENAPATAALARQRGRKMGEQRVSDDTGLFAQFRALDTGIGGDARTLHEARASMRERLSGDEQVISDIVTVMFDRLLLEARLPVALRPIVARLQIPVLELALNDSTLLTNIAHPVRKLIDLVAEFGLTLGFGGDDDSKVRSVANIIDGVARIHSEEPRAFQLGFEQLDSLFYHHEEASLQADAALRELERNEAEAFAGIQVDREIAVRLQNLTLPPAISGFMTTAWREVLVHDYLRGGSQGEPWKLGLSTLDDIIKSLRTSTADTERKRLARNLPAFIELLLNTPCANTPDAAYAPHAPHAPHAPEYQNAMVANFFTELQRAHQLLDAGKADEIGGERFVPSAEALAAAATVASPSAALNSMGLSCGNWIETHDFSGVRRWRLSWVTSIRGTCIFKHYESNSTRHIGCEDLRSKLASGEVRRVNGLGLADDVISHAFETVSRMARRASAAQGNLVAETARQRAPAQSINLR